MLLLLIYDTSNCSFQALIKTTLKPNNKSGHQRLYFSKRLLLIQLLGFTIASISAFTKRTFISSLIGLFPAGFFYVIKDNENPLNIRRFVIIAECDDNPLFTTLRKP